MWILYLVGLIVLVYYLFRDTKRPDTPQEPSADINKQWVDFVIGYLPLAKTKSEKKLLHRMLGDLSDQGMPVPAEYKSESPLDNDESLLRLDADAAPAHATVYSQSFIESPIAQEVERDKVQVQLDNTTLLLYFGAFLFVASIGLFIAFGGLPGSVRTFAVLLVAAVMYGGGLWLFDNKSKLEQAGLAFTGIGLAAAPFVGLAAYNFWFNKESGTAVWFVTSVACLGLYLHALLRLKKPLLNYILIFTLLSMVESSVSIIDAPLYYFGWGLSAVGLLLVILSHQMKLGAEFQEASYTSSRIFMPLAVFVSLIMIPEHGVGQLAVSMFLAAVLYATEFKYGREVDRVENAAVAQIAATISVLAAGLAVESSLKTATLVLMGVAVLKTLVLLIRFRPTPLWETFTTLTLVTSIAGVACAISDAGYLAVSLGVILAISIAIWLRQKDLGAYITGVTALMALPLVFGQYYLEPTMKAIPQLLLVLAAFLVQWAVVWAWRSADTAEALTAKVLYILSTIVAVVVAWPNSPAVFFAAIAVISVTFWLLQERNKKADWAIAAGIVQVLPMAQAVDNRAWCAVAMAVALLTNIALALRYRQEVNRWTGTIIWLLAPVILGNGLFGYWTPTAFTWAYIVILLGLVFARAIARGALFMSSKVPLASYAQSASISYVVGYILAGFIALASSFSTGNTRVHTTLVLLILMIITLWLARAVEKKPELYAALPWLAQAALLSGTQISTQNEWFNAYLLGSTALAAGVYVLLIGAQTKSQFYQQAIAATRSASIVAGAITPLSYLFASKTTFMMPVGLLVLTAMLYHYGRQQAQANKEWLGGLGLAAIWWFMGYFGVTNVQAYTHVLAALFALYAYIRHIRGDKNTSDQYLIAMLATSTVPLIFQSLSSSAGGIYGWWLLLEQVFFMLLGITLGKSIVTRWGLYVAVGAVLYQLRGFGWAALTVLAIFIIGIAVYRLQKQDDKK